MQTQGTRSLVENFLMNGTEGEHPQETLQGVNLNYQKSTTYALLLAMNHFFHIQATRYSGSLSLEEIEIKGIIQGIPCHHEGMKSRQIR